MWALRGRGSRGGRREAPFALSGAGIDIPRPTQELACKVGATSGGLKFNMSKSQETSRAARERVLMKIGALRAGGLMIAAAITRRGSLLRVLPVHGSHAEGCVSYGGCIERHGLSKVFW
jgi:hypothetical protein